MTSSRRALPDHIAFVIADLSSGGAQRVLVQIAEQWSRKGYRVAVITLADKDADFFTLDHSIQRISLAQSGSSRGVWDSLRANIGRIRALRRALRQSEAALVVSFVHATNILTILACAGMPARVVVSERNDPLRQKLPWMWHALRRLTYRWATAVTANNSAALAVLSRYVPHRKLAWLPNPIALALPWQKRPDGPPIVLAVARLVHQKGIDVLLRAFQTVLRHEPACRLLIAGEGPLRSELHALAAALQIGHAVEWRAPSADVVSLYRSATLLALPSRFEGTPNVVLEAMASGLFVVVSDHSGGALDFVVTGESGLVVPAEDPDRLADAILYGLGNADARDRMARTAWERVQPWTGERAADAWEDTLQRYIR